MAADLPMVLPGLFREGRLFQGRASAVLGEGLGTIPGDASREARGEFLPKLLELLPGRVDGVQLGSECPAQGWPEAITLGPVLGRPCGQDLCGLWWGEQSRAALPGALPPSRLRMARNGPPGSTDVTDYSQGPHFARGASLSAGGGRGMPCIGPLQLPLV